MGEVITRQHQHPPIFKKLVPFQSTTIIINTLQFLNSPSQLFTFLSNTFQHHPLFLLPPSMNRRLGFLLFLSLFYSTESRCSQTCDLALANYYVLPGDTLSSIAENFKSDVLQSADTIVNYNRDKIPNKDSVQASIRINIPFPCDCVSNGLIELPGYEFKYDVQSGDTYTTVANETYANLTTVSWLQQFNSYPENNIPDTGILNVSVNCSCGDSSISKDYGLFITYPLRPGDTIDEIATEANVSADLLRKYNVDADFSRGSGVIFIPGKGGDSRTNPFVEGGNDANQDNKNDLTCHGGDGLVMPRGPIIRSSRNKLKAALQMYIQSLVTRDIKEEAWVRLEEMESVCNPKLVTLIGACDGEDN